MNEKEMLLAERIAKAIGTDVEIVENTSFVVLMTRLVEVIENGLSVSNTGGLRDSREERN